LPMALMVLAVTTAACDDTASVLRGGEGVTESDAFPLEPDRYDLAWTASPQTVSGCELKIELLNEADDAVASVDESFGTGGARQGVEPVRQIGPGTFRLRVDTTCEQWTARVAR